MQKTYLFYFFMIIVLSCKEEKIIKKNKTPREKDEITLINRTPNKVTNNSVIKKNKVEDNFDFICD